MNSKYSPRLVPRGAGSLLLRREEEKTELAKDYFFCVRSEEGSSHREMTTYPQLLLFFPLLPQAVKYHKQTFYVRNENNNQKQNKLLTNKKHVRKKPKI